MNRSYQVYLRNQSSIFLKKIMVISIIFLTLMIIAYIFQHHFTSKNIKDEEQRQRIALSYSKSNAINASKGLVSESFTQLNQARKDNTENGRQYMIETLTRIAENSQLSNFVIDKISEKNSTVPIMYKDLDTIAHPSLYEIEINFNTVFQRQFIEFLNSINSEINGQIIIHKLETIRTIKEIDNDTITQLNSGENISMIRTHLVLHWFFLK